MPWDGLLRDPSFESRNFNGREESMEGGQGRRRGLVVATALYRLLLYSELNSCSPRLNATWTGLSLASKINW